MHLFRNDFGYYLHGLSVEKDYNKNQKDVPLENDKLDSLKIYEHCSS